MKLLHLNSGSDFGASMPSRGIFLNDLSANSPKFWSRRMQRIHHKINNFRQTANFEERARLTKGQQVTRPSKSSINVQDYAKGVAFVVQDIDATEELLNVNKSKVAPFYVDDIDNIQNIFSAVNEWAKDATTKLNNEIDADYQGEFINAGLSVDDSDVTGGVAGDGITPSVSNVLKIFSTAGRKLDDNNIEQENRFANISPFLMQLVTEHLAGKDTALGDKTSLGGHRGKFMNFDLFVTTNLSAVVDLALATQLTTGDTVIINGVTFTGVSTIGAVAGNFLLGANVDAARANLAGLINNPKVTSATQVALNTVAPGPTQDSDAEKFRRIAGVNNDTTDVLTITGTGTGRFTVSDTLTDTVDGFTAAKQVQHCLFGKKGAIDVVIQKEPTVKFKDVPDKIGQNIVPWDLYGIKTFLEGQQMLVDVVIRTDSQ